MGTAAEAPAPSTSPRQVLLAWLAPLAMLVVAYAATWVTDWMNDFGATRHLVILYPKQVVFAINLLVVGGAALLYARLERLHPRLRSWLRYAALLIPLWFVFLSGARSAGILADWMRVLFVAVSGAMVGIMLALWARMGGVGGCET
ncbi:MAG TPA: hypothetical protein VGR60_04195 [Gemmatimonadales bacterium]|nr:hypothetical protein [Gemmatimonadales bacterium]